MAATQAFPVRALLGRFEAERLEHSAWAGYLPSALRETALAAARSLPDGDSGHPAGLAAATAAKGLLLHLSADRLDTRTGCIAGRVLVLSRDARGCREVQRVLEELDCDVERELLAKELQGHIWEAIRCPHANHVVQKCILVLPPQACQFIIDEVMDGKLIPAARHKYGCRIIQRLIEHCPAEQVLGLVARLLAEFLDVARHPYGTFVVQHLLRHSTEEQRSHLADLVERHVADLAANPHGTAVLVAALETGDLLDRVRLAEIMLEDAEIVTSSGSTRHGDAIVRNLVQVLDCAGCERLLAILPGHPEVQTMSAADLPMKTERSDDCSTSCGSE